MKRLEFTPRARRDLEEIWEYSFEQFGLDKADAYLRTIQRAVATVTEGPRRGLATTRFAPAIASSQSALPSCSSERRRTGLSSSEYSMRGWTSNDISVEAKMNVGSGALFVSLPRRRARPSRRARGLRMGDGGGDRRHGRRAAELHRFDRGRRHDDDGRVAAF